MASNEDESLLVRFFVQREKNEALSLKEGRDVYEEVENVSIRVPGSRDEVVNLVTDEHRERFKAIYKSWKADEADPVTGTPLSEWPAATASFIEEMRFYGVRTVEELAKLSDGHMTGHPGWMTMRTRAQAWLETTKSDAAAQRFAVENEALKAQMAAMQAQIERLAAQQAEDDDDEQPRRRGRPPKARPDEPEAA